MSTLHKPYPKPSYTLPAWAAVAREIATSHEHFDLMYKQCQDWQAARRKAEQAIGPIAYPYHHPALAKQAAKAEIGRGIVVTRHKESNMYRNRVDYLTIETIDGKYKVTIKRDYLLGRQYEVSKQRAQQIIRLLDNPNVMCRPYLFSGTSITIGYRPKPAQYAMLVYQAGIANVFLVDLPRLNDYDRHAKRLYQGDFHSAICFARGLGTAGYVVRTAGCNQVGDIAKSEWTATLRDLPFSEHMVNVHMN